MKKEIPNKIKSKKIKENLNNESTSISDESKENIINNLNIESDIKSSKKRKLNRKTARLLEGGDVIKNEGEMNGEDVVKIKLEGGDVIKNEGEMNGEDVLKIKLEEHDDEMNIDDQEFLPYDEYYPTDRYAVDAENNDRYAKKRNFDEFYLEKQKVEQYAVKRLKSGETIPFYARTKRREPLVARDEKGLPIYPENNGEVLFPELKSDQAYHKLSNGKEIYPEDNDSNQLYKKDVEGNEYFAKDERGIQYYATRFDKVTNEQLQYLPVDKNKAPIKSFVGNKYVYPLNLTTGRPIYEKNLDGDELYWYDDKGSEYYGKDTSGNGIYAKNKNRDRDIVAVDENSHEFYAKNAKGKSIYPTDNIEGEFYIRIYNTELIATDEKFVPYYAKDKNGDEIYPRKY